MCTKQNPGHGQALGRTMTYRTQVGSMWVYACPPAAASGGHSRRPGGWGSCCPLRLHRALILFSDVGTRAGGELHLKGKWPGRICMDWQKIIFYLICKGALGMPRSGAFKDICVLWAKGRTGVSANATGLKINLAAEVKVFCGGGQRTQGGGTESFFSFSLSWDRRWSGDRWCFE